MAGGSTRRRILSDRTKCKTFTAEHAENAEKNISVLKNNNKTIHRRGAKGAKKNSYYV